MIKDLGKVGLVLLIVLFSLLAVGSLNAKTLKVIDAYHYIKNHRSCLKDLVDAVQFGAFSNLKIDKCNINNGKVDFIVDIKLSKPYSRKNVKQFLMFVDAFGSEVGIVKKELLTKKICKFSSMPKGAKCYAKFANESISASAYEGVNAVKLHFIDK